ncbi:DUF1217 domain-containing protein [Neorhizobium galegae]|nr:DUF1217 domain-containing protein [Neorhizobium galegae]
MKSTIEQILTSDLADPNSYANRFGDTNPEYLELAKAFNFNTDGTVAAGQAQDGLQTSSTRSDYMSRWDDKQEADLDKAIKFYKLDLTAVRTLDDFLSKDAQDSYNFALEAVGLDPATVSKLTIKHALKSDLSDPESYIYKLKDERFVSLAKFFNFDTNGGVTRQVLLQSNAAITNVAKDYILRKSRFMEGDELKAARAKAQTEAKYYTDAMQRIGSRDELLADRKTLDILLISKGIDPSTVTNDFLKEAFNSDPADPKSFVNTQTDKRFAQIVGTFNFDSKGEIDRSSAGEAQNGGEVVATQDLYVRQMLETQQGEGKSRRPPRTLFRAHVRQHHRPLRYPGRRGADGVLPDHLQPAPGNRQHGCRSAGQDSGEKARSRRPGRSGKGEEIGAALHDHVRSGE